MAPALSPSPGAPPSVRRPLGPRIAGGAALAALAWGLWWAAHQQSTVTRQAAEDSVLIPVVAPPPPPPPPPEVKPVEKPEEMPPQPVNQPTPQPQPPSPSPQAATPNAGQAVAIDGPAQAGGDAFNIGAGSGGGMSGSGRIGSALSGFNRAGYAAYLEGEVRRALEGSKALRTAALKARVKTWIDPGGRITRVEVSDTGDDARAGAIRAALTGLHVRAPDAGLAMPVNMSLDLRRPG